MKAIRDPNDVLAMRLAELRAEHQVPKGFPDPVLAAADAAISRAPTEHADRTDRPFVTLDPASAIDLDQAFDIEVSGSDIILHYAIADVAWFVQDGDALDLEAWNRGATVYLPDGKVSLYPRLISENAASLLPGGPRPAVVFSVRVDPNGKSSLDGAERALIRSRAKLAYDRVRPDELPAGFQELSRRIQAAEAARGAHRVDPPEQEVASQEGGGFTLRFRPRAPAEDQNASLSLAANLAIADALLANRTGLFRTMAEPDDWAVRRLRHTAQAFGIPWKQKEPLSELERRLDPRDPKQGAMMLAIRRASRGASYAPFKDGERPWHAAMAATYAHATAPLRRLADRYVVMATLAIANGRPVPAAVTEAFNRLPEVMSEAAAFSGRLERAAIDIAEAVMLQGREGQIFPAVITDADDRGARIQLTDLPVVARLQAKGVKVGQTVHVRLVSTDRAPATFVRAS